MYWGPRSAAALRSARSVEHPPWASSCTESSRRRPGAVSFKTENCLVSLLRIEFFPAPVYSEALRVRLVHHWQPALIPWFPKLTVESGERNIFTVVLIERGIVFSLGDEDDAVGTTIIHRCQAHRADHDRRGVEVFEF